MPIFFSPSHHLYALYTRNSENWCRNKWQMSEEIYDIWPTLRHVEDMSTTFPTKLTRIMLGTPVGDRKVCLSIKGSKVRLAKGDLKGLFEGNPRRRQSQTTHFSCCHWQRLNLWGIRFAWHSLPTVHGTFCWNRHGSPAQSCIQHSGWSKGIDEVKIGLVKTSLRQEFSRRWWGWIEGQWFWHDGCGKGIGKIVEVEMVAAGVVVVVVVVKWQWNLRGAMMVSDRNCKKNEHVL